MELLLIQSQEHDKLPLAELNAVLETEEMDVEIEKVHPDIAENVFDDYYRILVRRLAYTHEVHHLISKISYDDMEDGVESIDWSLFIDENFAVRVKRIDSDIDTVATERKIGSLILSSTDGISVNLSNPKSFIPMKMIFTFAMVSIS